MKVKELISYLKDINSEALVLIEDRGEDGFGWKLREEHIIPVSIKQTDIRDFYSTRRDDTDDKNNKLTCDAILF